MTRDNSTLEDGSTAEQQASPELMLLVLTQTARVRESEEGERRLESRWSCCWEAVKQRHWWYYDYMPLRLVLLPSMREASHGGSSASTRQDEEKHVGTWQSVAERGNASADAEQKRAKAEHGERGRTFDIITKLATVGTIPSPPPVMR
ncbi:hypothetical protein LI328DRAFT_158630 [Trichoderma asperelloides]|nr:hypothetical protein LI328DRAFT_158630 [Trichoderma asperelloides]